ncbi:MAG: hypothetical protein GTO22_03540, partial [Gemmatimonadales bacterium]|nr:hypothetical protein [Gemmatimonadales bacterium]
MAGDAMKAGESRVWLFEDGYGPGNGKEYFGFARIGDPTYGFGDSERIEAPSEDQFNEFDEIDSIQGAKERPTSSVIGRYPRTDRSTLLRIGSKRCPSGVQTIVGKCVNPQDYDAKWDKIIVFTDVKYSSWSGENFGALASDEQAAVNETGEFNAKDLYEVMPLSFGEQCAAEVAREIIKILVCDQVECGDCDEPTDGCQKVFAVQLGTGATPGTLPSVVYSDDGGDTCASQDISTLFSNEDPDDAACVGSDLVVISSDGGMHIAPQDDILDGTDSWVEPTTGFVAGQGPICITSAGSRHTWLGAVGGYIYFTADPRTGVSVQDAGVATTQDLQDIHAFDKNNVVAVGNLNAVVRTSNGGATWQAVTGPSVGNTLNCVWMYDERTWFVGDSVGGFYYTTDEGDNWTAQTMPITLVEIDEIEFFDEVVGYVAARRGAADGVLLRTTDGGQTWYVMPKKTGSIPANDR